MSAKNEEFVTAARATGASRGRILMSHIIPNSMAPIIVYATVALARSSCPRPPCPSWASACRPRSSPGALTSRPPRRPCAPTRWVLFYPGAALALTRPQLIMMGDAVREALDPKARK